MKKIISLTFVFALVFSVWSQTWAEHPEHPTKTKKSKSEHPEHPTKTKKPKSKQSKKSEHPEHPTKKEHPVPVDEDLAPAFTLKDSNGKEHSLASFEGSYVVLEWVNYDCPFVKKHYRSGSMQRLQETYTDKGVIWLSICSSAPGKQGHFTGEALKRRIAKEGSKATAYLVDETGRVGKAYGARTTPHMFVIDPKGKLVYQGAIDNIRSASAKSVDKATNYVKQVLDAFLAGEPAPLSKTPPYGCSVKY